MFCISFILLCWMFWDKHLSTCEKRIYKISPKIKILKIFLFHKTYIILYYILYVGAKSEAIRLGLTRAHNLFVLWAWVSYFGLFTTQRLNEITSSSGSFYSLSFPYFFMNLSTTTFSSSNFSYLWSKISGETMITCIVNAMGGLMSLIVSGCLGGNGVWWEWLWKWFPLQ